MKKREYLNFLSTQKKQVQSLGFLKLPNELHLFVSQCHYARPPLKQKIISTYHIPMYTTNNKQFDGSN
jgi:hypothetical protein